MKGRPPLFGFRARCAPEFDLWGAGEYFERVGIFVKIFVPNFVLFVPFVVRYCNVRRKPATKTLNHKENHNVVLGVFVSWRRNLKMGVKDGF